MTHTCVNKLKPHWFKYWPVTWSAESQYLNGWWFIVIHRDKLQWKLNQNNNCHSSKYIWKCPLQNIGHIVPASMLLRTEFNPKWHRFPEAISWDSKVNTQLMTPSIIHTEVHRNFWKHLFLLDRYFTTMRITQNLNTNKPTERIWIVDYFQGDINIGNKMTAHCTFKPTLLDSIYFDM